MRRSWARFLAVPTMAAGVVAGVVVAAPSAFAQTDTGGTVVVTVPYSYIAQLAKSGVVVSPLPLSELAFDNSTETATITFKVTGGDGDVSTFSGQVDLSGTLEAVDANHHSVNIAGLDLNLLNGDIEGTPAGTSTPIGLLDLAGNITFSAPVGATTETYDATQLLVDPQGAAYLNSALHSSAFVANENIGTIAATWSISD